MHSLYESNLLPLYECATTNKSIYLPILQMITKATADGTLDTRNWDVEPLFPMSNAVVKQE